MAKTYAQKFGQRKADKYRKYAADLREDIARLPAEDSARLIGLLRQTLAGLDELGRQCGDDPFDGL